MNYPKIAITEEQALDLSDFKQMDYFAVENYHLPIELMMENAGLHLARLAAQFAGNGRKVTIGVGVGNNGGGGLVAARRLAAWGFDVRLDIPDEALKSLPMRQLERAIGFGAKKGLHEKPDVFVDAYFGFSQRLPLPIDFRNAIKKANRLDGFKLSLDIPAGYSRNDEFEFFKPDAICTLAAPKKILFADNLSARVFIADLGIPKEVYQRFGFEQDLPFAVNGIVEVL